MYLRSTVNDSDVVGNINPKLTHAQLGVWLAISILSSVHKPSDLCMYIECMLVCNSVLKNQFYYLFLNFCQIDK